MIYVQTSGRAGVVLSLGIENVSNRIIRLAAVRLETPLANADFQCVQKPAASQARKFGGYVLPACGTCGFDPSVVLNHRFGRRFQLYPKDRIEGLLLVEGTISVPDEHLEHRRVPRGSGRFRRES